MKGTILSCFVTYLALLAPISQNGQTHSNSSSANVFDHFVGLALKGLGGKFVDFSHDCITLGSS